MSMAEGDMTSNERAELESLRVKCEKLRDAILDIDAHAVAMGSDEDGFNSGGYLVSIGSLHRALGVIGHSGVTPREHAVSIELAHGDGCQHCQQMKLIVLDSIEAAGVRKFKESRTYG